MVAVSLQMDKNSLINVEALPKLTKMTMTHLMHFIKVKEKRTSSFRISKISFAVHLPGGQGFTLDF